MSDAFDPIVADALRRLDALVARIPPEAYFDAGVTDHNVYVWFDGAIPRYVGIGDNPSRRFIHWTGSFMPEKDDYFVRHKETLWLASAADGVTNTVACEIERVLIAAFGKMSDGGTLLNKHPGQRRRRPSDGVDKIGLKQLATIIPLPPDLPFKKRGRAVADWKKADMAKTWFPNDCVIGILRLPVRTNGSAADEKFSFYRDGMTVAELIEERRSAKIMKNRSPARVQSDLIWDTQHGFIKVVSPGEMRQVDSENEP
jgi:hypothetical protein